MRRTNLIRRGMTLAELLVSVAVLSIIAGVLGGLATAVQINSEYGHGHAAAIQQSRVAQERIGRAVAEAYATSDYPGAVVVYDVLGSWRFPDTLVVWRPEGTPANAAGPPLVNELVLFCPNPSDPQELLEITAPDDARAIPLNESLNGGAWRAMIENIKTAADSRRAVLSNLLRAPQYNGAARGAVRFECERHPSDTAWQEYEAGTVAWDDLVWPQGIVGSQAGMRQVWVRYEWQLMPGETAAANDPGGQQAATYFGSAACYYELDQ